MYGKMAAKRQILSNTHFTVFKFICWRDLVNFQQVDAFKSHAFMQLLKLKTKSSHQSLIAARHLPQRLNRPVKCIEFPTVLIKSFTDVM